MTGYKLLHLSAGDLGERLATASRTCQTICYRGVSVTSASSIRTEGLRKLLAKQAKQTQNSVRSAVMPRAVQQF